MQKGYIALTAVLLISAVIIALCATVTYNAVGEGQAVTALYKGESALATTEGCAEDGLIKKRSSASYSGGSIVRPEGTCTISFSGPSGNSWTMTATTTATDYRRTVQVIFTLSSSGIQVTSWQEI